MILLWIYLSKVESGADGKNVVVSPLSVMTTLSMLANGDNGDSRDAILGLLGFAGKSEGLDRLNEYCKVIYGIYRWLIHLRNASWPTLSGVVKTHLFRILRV